MVEEKSKIIPNSYQTPNYLIDVVMRLLSGNEQKCVDVVCRKTFGWQKRSDRISKSQLITLTGIGEKAIDKCMAQLTKYHVVIRVSESIHNWGVEWSIQIDDRLIDIIGLQKRDAKRRHINIQKTSKANINKVGSSNVPPASNVPPGGSSNVPHKSHYQKPKESSSSSADEKVILFFSKEIGKVTPTIKEKLLHAKAFFTEEWVLEALAEAVHYNKPSWAYAEKILKRWKEEGFKTKKKGAGNATSNNTRKGSAEYPEQHHTDQDRKTAERIVQRQLERRQKKL